MKTVNTTQRVCSLAMAQAIRSIEETFGETGRAAFICPTPDGLFDVNKGRGCRPDLDALGRGIKPLGRWRR